MSKDFRNLRLEYHESSSPTLQSDGSELTTETMNDYLFLFNWKDLTMKQTC